MVTDKQRANLRTPSTSEARERGRKGGKSRAANIAKRKSIKDDLLALLETEQQNGKTIQENWLIALAKQLLAGNVRASEFVRDTVGEKPVSKMAITADEESVKKMDEFFNFLSKGGGNEC